MNILRKIRFATQDDDIDGFTYCQRSSATTAPNVCISPIITNCRVNMIGNADPFVFEIGDVVYNTFSGTTLFNGNNLLYVFVTSIAPETVTKYLCQVDTLGVITSVTTYTCV